MRIIKKSVRGVAQAGGGSECAGAFNGVVNQERLIAALTEEVPLKRRRALSALLAAYRREILDADRAGRFPRAQDESLAAMIFDAFQALQPPRGTRTLRLFRHDAAVKEELRQTLYLLRWCFWRRRQGGTETYCSPQEFGKLSAFSTEVNKWE